MTAEIRELLPLFTLNALAADEQARLEAHVANCSECQAELRELRETCANLAEAVETAPPPDLKSRLLAKVMDSPVRRGILLDNDGILLARSEELGWKQVFPGVEIKVLNRDRERGYRASMVRIAPGAVFPRHAHAGVEEIFVLSGDINLEGTTARAGDYCRAEAKSIHQEAFSVNGCTFFVTSSQHDEILS